MSTPTVFPGYRPGRPTDERLCLMTQAEVARVLGIGRSRVGQLERSGLKKLRARLLALGVER